jgi:hypothetical protein
MWPAGHKFSHYKSVQALEGLGLVFQIEEARYMAGGMWQELMSE